MECARKRKRHSWLRFSHCWWTKKGKPERRKRRQGHVHERMSCTTVKRHKHFAASSSQRALRDWHKPTKKKKKRDAKKKNPQTNIQKTHKKKRRAKDSKLTCTHPPTQARFLPVFTCIFSPVCGSFSKHCASPLYLYASFSSTSTQLVTIYERTKKKGERKKKKTSKYQHSSNNKKRKQRAIWRYQTFSFFFLVVFFFFVVVVSQLLHKWHV